MKNEGERYRDTHLDIDFTQRSAVLEGCKLVLTRKEYELLATLVRNAGEIVRRDALLLGVWGYGDQIRTRTLDVHVRRLRRKLGRFSHLYIETVFGVGYRFQPLRSDRRPAPGLSALALGA